MIGLDDLLQATARHGGELVGAPFARGFSAFSNDSRTVAPGELFVALRTDRADGHDYIDDAVARGAAGVLCERPPDRRFDVTIIRVADTRAALLDWAAHVLEGLRPSSIAVIGAVGKSSARAALLRALAAQSPDDPSCFTNGDRNDELGLPLALGGLGREHRLAVLELAGGTGAELARLGALVRPRVVLLTSAGPPEAADPASTSLRRGLTAFLSSCFGGSTGLPHLADTADESGVPSALLIVNGDDPWLGPLLAESAVPAGVHRLSFGTGETADVRGLVLHASPEGTLLEISRPPERARVLLHAPGRGAVYAALAAAAAATALGRGLLDVAARLEGLPALPGRLAPLRSAGGATVLDDTVSASVTSLDRALETLARFPRPHAAVLGEIAGGEHADQLGATSLERLLGLDLLVLEGAAMAALGRDLRARSRTPARIVLTYSPRDSADALDGSAAGGTSAGTVLVKGSDAARMERVVDLLLPEGEDRTGSLVRQDEGWRRRTYVPNERPTWVEVDLEAIRFNLQALRRAAAPAEVMAVLKADAYGHGARWVARTVALNGATMLGVASLNEALDLRADGITTPILILGYSPPWQALDLALSDIRATVFSLSVAEHYARVAADLGRRIAVHVKVDTGMTRLGVLPDDVPAFIDAVTRLPGLVVEGIFSHMATSDSDVGFALEQGEAFTRLVQQLAERGHTFRYVHMENSAAVMRGLPFAGNLVRAGLALYGLYPLPPGETSVVLRPALSFKTRVAQVKCVPAGTAVSYGRTYVTGRPSLIAILPVGYGDGFRRGPANWGHVLVRGRRAPIRGVVAMDMTMIDVTDVEGVQEGDEVVLIGRQGDDAITAEDVAAALGTIAYEVVTQILPRVPRQTR